MDLREYEQQKFALAEILRAAGNVVPRDDRDWHDRAQTLFARLAEDRFNLVVVGRFSRGKSSLMNAIMGMDRLPTGIVPLTSVITTVGYGSKEKAILSFEGRILTHEVPISELPRYVTQEGNPGNVQRIQKAELQLPAEILRRGFYFVDTPGLGSAIAENTRTTEAFLPEADAFLLVTSYESPLSEDEMRFLRFASSSAQRVFVVLNKHDAVAPAERRRAVDFVKAQLASILSRQRPDVFSVSARDGLEAKLTGNARLLTESGLPPLERALTHYLLTEKSREFLIRMCARAGELVRGLPPGSDKQELLAKLASISTHIGEAIQAPADASVAGLGAGAVQPVRSCEICAEVAKVLWDFLCRFQYEISANEAEQERFARSNGLCSFHTWQYESIASPQGTCTGYAPLLDRLAAALRGDRLHSRDGPASPELHDLLSTRDGCAMCTLRAEAEAEAVSRLAGRIRKAPQQIDSLSAFCLPHLAMLLGAIDDAALMRRLLDREASILERLAEDMRRYALKRDGVKRHLLSEEETAAAQQALLILAGNRNVNPVPEGNPPKAAARNSRPLNDHASAPHLGSIDGTPP